MVNKLFKKQLTIKTKFNPEHYDDVRKFEEACFILKSEGVEFEVAEERVATEFGKKLYFRYSLITDIIIWIVIPIVSLIILL